MNGLLADAKHAFRIYRRTPLASLIAVGVLAIGMAFLSAFVSLYVDLNLRPYPGLEDIAGVREYVLELWAKRVTPSS